jgi:hypothetical protein
LLYLVKQNLPIVLKSYLLTNKVQKANGLNSQFEEGHKADEIPVIDNFMSYNNIPNRDLSKVAYSSGHSSY